MDEDFASPKVITKRLTGIELFMSAGMNSNVSVLDYWRWAHSNLVSNIERGVLAEFLVATALGVSKEPAHRDPWQDSDIVIENLKIEVKSAAYIQDWSQRELSNIVFARLQGKPVDDLQNTEVSTYKSDIYVLSLLTTKNNETLNILDLDQWCFWVFSRHEISELTNNSASISLKKIESAGEKPISFTQLRAKIMEKRILN